MSAKKAESAERAVRAPVIAMDGPAGAGKGAVSQRVASELGWHYLDSGALYRAVTVLARRHQLLAEEEQADKDQCTREQRFAQLVTLMQNATFHCQVQASGTARIVLNGEDVSEVVREERIGTMAARIAREPSVRRALVHLQRDAQRAPGLVAEGRDMGSVVFRDAETRVFLTASVEVRAERRQKQLQAQGFDVNIAALRQSIEARDHSDTTRAHSPLAPAEGAHVVDTSSLTITEAAALVIALHRNK